MLACTATCSAGWLAESRIDCAPCPGPRPRTEREGMAGVTYISQGATDPARAKGEGLLVLPETCVRNPPFLGHLFFFFKFVLIKLIN